MAAGLEAIEGRGAADGVCIQQTPPLEHGGYAVRERSCVDEAPESALPSLCLDFSSSFPHDADVLSVRFFVHRPVPARVEVPEGRRRSAADVADDAHAAAVAAADRTMVLQVGAGLALPQCRTVCPLHRARGTLTAL